MRNENSKVAIQKQRRNIGGDQQVLQIAREQVQFVDFLPVLLVDRLQLLVDALQFLPRRLQLFHGGTQLFGGRLPLLIRRLHHRPAAFALLGDGLQALLSPAERPLQILNLLCVRPRRLAGFLGRAQSLALLKNHEGDSLFLDLEGGPHTQYDGSRLFLEVHGDRPGIVAHPVCPHLLERRLELEPKLLAHHLQRILCRFPFRPRQVAPRVLREVQYPVVRPYQHAGGRVLFRHPLVLLAMRGGCSGYFGRRAAVAWKASLGQRKNRQAGPPGRNAAFPEEAQFLVVGPEQVRWVHRFGGAQDECALRLQRVMKQLDDLLLNFALQVDQEIAAGNQVQPGEGRVGQKVVGREDHKLAQLLPDPVAAMFLLEEPLQPLRTYVRRDFSRVEALARLFQRPAVKVSSEHLDAGRGFLSFRLFHQQHRQAVRFFPGGAAD